MRVSEIIGKKTIFTNPSSFTTSMLNKEIKRFFVDLCSWNGVLAGSHVKELNVILNSLEVCGVMVLDKVNTHNNGVYKAVTIGDEYIIKATKAVLLRKKVKIDYIVDFNTKSLDQEVFKTDKTTPFDTLVALQYLRKKMTSTERGIEFNLTLNQMAKLLKTKRCYYSGVELTLGGVHCHTIDRVDSDKPYDVLNTVACSGLVNSIKNKLIDNGENLDDLTPNQMKKMLLSFIDII